MNGEKQLFNWQIGRDLVQKKAEERWGAGVVDQVSLDLKKEFPNEDGFSTSNLWYMKKWYLFYTNHASSEILQLFVGELKLHDSQLVAKLHQDSGEYPFAFVPWRHHVEIITKSKSIKEALFNVGKTIEHGLSSVALINCFKVLQETWCSLILFVYFCRRIGLKTMTNFI